MPDGTETVTNENVQNTNGQTQTNEPSPEEKLLAMIDQRVKTSVEGTIKEVTERSRREIQSAKDKATAEVQRAQREAQQIIGSIEAITRQVGTDDPDLGNRLRLGQLEALNSVRANQEAQRQQEMMMEKAKEDFDNAVSSILQGLKIDPNDPALDKATDTANFTEKMQRMLGSAVSLRNQQFETAQAGFEARLKALEGGQVQKSDDQTQQNQNAQQVNEQTRQANIQANSVATTPSQNSGDRSASDAEFMRQFGANEIPLTKENLQRYEQIIQS